MIRNKRIYDGCNKIYRFFIVILLLFLVSCVESTIPRQGSSKLNQIKIIKSDVSFSLKDKKTELLSDAIKVIFHDFHPDNSSDYLSFGFPLPLGFRSEVSFVAVLDKNGLEIPSHINSAVNYFDFMGIKSRPRSLKITIDRRYASNEGYVYISLKMKHKKFIELPAGYKVRNEWSYFKDKNYSGFSTLKEPSIYASLPAAWLVKCNLLGDSIELMAYPEMGWFDRAYINFSHTAVNNVSPFVKPEYLIPLTDRAEPWLFDRTKTLFGIYIRTGDVFWLRHAHRSAEYYRHKINVDGFFSLKKTNDLKYSYPLSLALALIFTADLDILPVIRKTVNSTLDWPDHYTNRKKFWTERHQNYALLAAMIGYQITGERSYKLRTLKLIENSYKMINSIDSEWISSDCMLHTMHSHEGVYDSRPVCSPWMSALFSETLMLYHSVSNDERALDMIKSFADFITIHSLYTDKRYSKFQNLLVPWYLASGSVKFSDSGFFSDWDHACDVAGLLARGVLIKKKLSELTLDAEDKLNKLLNACFSNLENAYRHDSDHSYGKPVWRLSPSRKYNWIFGSTFELPRLMKEIDKKFTE